MTDSIIGKSKITASTVGRLAAASVLALGLAVAAPASAAPAGAHHSLSTAQQKQYQAYRKIETALLHDRGELVKIRQATFRKHPELITQQKDYADMIVAEMQHKGYAPKKTLKELNALQDQLHSGKTKGAKRKALLREFQTKFVAFRENEQKVLNMPKLKAARNKLKDAVLAAMRKENPKTDSLLKDMSANRNKLMALRRSAAHQK